MQDGLDDWPVPAGVPTLAPGEVHAWRAWLEFLFWAYAMGLLFIPAIGLFALLCGASAAMSLPFEEMLVGLSILPTALSGVLLYCFARAEAAHFERFTFDRIDLPQA